METHRDAAVAEAAAQGRHAVGVGARVEDPADGVGLGVEGGDAVVVGADVDRAVERDRRAREAAGDGAELLARPVRGAPRPRRLEPVDVVRGQDVGGRVARVRGVAAHVGPLHCRTIGAGRPLLGACLLKKKLSALASSIVLVCRRRPDDAPAATCREFLTALRSELPQALRLLQTGNVAPVDLAQAAIGLGMAVYTRYAQVARRRRQRDRCSRVGADRRSSRTSLRTHRSLEPNRRIRRPRTGRSPGGPVAAPRQTRSTSNDARLRVSRLNSTATRWMGRPRPRCLSA